MRGKKVIEKQEVSSENDQFMGSEEKVNSIFLKKRIHFLNGDIADANISAAIKWIVYENALDTPKDTLLHLYINSNGGDLYNALALIDIMRLSEKPIRTIGFGSIISAAFLIFACGTKGERYLSKNSTLMCHQFSDSYEGKYHDLISHAKSSEVTNAKMLEILRGATGLSERTISNKLLRPSDVWMTPEEAVKLGIADHIL